MSTESEGYYDEGHETWYCNRCGEPIDADHYADRDAHVWAHYAEEEKAKVTDLKYARVEGYGAKFEGRAFIKMSQSHEEGINTYVEIELKDGSHMTWQTFEGWGGWTITEIPEPVVLPTKRDAIVRINGESLWHCPVNSGEDWIDSEGSTLQDSDVLAEAQKWGGMTVIFEGVDE